MFFHKLTELHNNGLYHGDIKFDNVMYDSNNKKMTFFDIKLHNKAYKPVYDFGYLLYSMKLLLGKVDVKMLKYIYKQIYFKIKCTSLTTLISGMEQVFLADTDQSFIERANTLDILVHQEIIDRFVINDVSEIPIFV